MTSASFVVWSTLAACSPDEHVIGRGDPISTEPVGACPEFDPGTNMLLVEWDDDPDNQAGAATVAQIVGDAAATSRRVNSELFAACSDLATVRGTDPGPSSIPPTLEETREACDAAIDGVGGLRTAQPELVVLIDATSKPCAVQAAIAECRASCPDGDTCAEFCTSAAPWMADCPDAEVVLTFEGEVGPGLQASWDAVQEATSAVIAARSRLRLANETLARLAFVPSSSYTLSGTCISRIIDSLTETNQANELSDDTIEGVLGAIAVAE